jgi:hypothetical protein
MELDIMLIKISQSQPGTYLVFSHMQNINLKRHEAGCQWLTPVMLATWEAEIGKIMVFANLGKKSTSPHLNQQLGAYHLPVIPSYPRGCYQEDHSSRPVQVKEKKHVRFHLIRKKLGMVVASLSYQ